MKLQLKKSILRPAQMLGFLPMILGATLTYAQSTELKSSASNLKNLVTTNRLSSELLQTNGKLKASVKSQRQLLEVLGNSEAIVKSGKKDINSLVGTNSGGGGGVYQLSDGQVVTLPEFGILLGDQVSNTSTMGKVYPRPPVIYDVPYEVRQSWDKIKTQIKASFPGVYFNEFGYFPDKTEKKIQVKTDIDHETYQKIKNEYRLVLEAFGYKLRDDKFILPAFSENGITYLLPDFNMLSNEQKAKVLVHEETMRDTSLNRIAALTKALKIDSLIQEIAYAAPGTQFDTFAILKRFARLGMIGERGVLTQIFTELIKEYKGPIPFSSLTQNINGELDPSMIQEIQIQFGLKLNYAEMLEGTSVNLLTQYGNRTTTFERKHCAKDGVDSERWVIPSEFDSRFIAVTKCYDNVDAVEEFIILAKPGPFIQKIMKD